MMSSTRRTATKEEVRDEVWNWRWPGLTASIFLRDGTLVQVRPYGFALYERLRVTFSESGVAVHRVKKSAMTRTAAGLVVDLPREEVLLVRVIPLDAPAHAPAHALSIDPQVFA